MASRATDHGEIVEVIRWSRSWRLVPLIMEMSRSWRLVPQIMEVDVPVVQVHLKGRILRHFWFIVDFFFGALDGTQFLLCVVEGRWVALTPGVELPGVGPSGRAN